MNKLIVAPQIVIYKNIFKNSKDLIELLNTEYESVMSPWDNWYTNGSRRGILYKNIEVLEVDSNNIKKEKQYLKEFYDILEFIKKDYFSEFNKGNGIWPEFIFDWDKLLSNDIDYYMDFFKYDIDKIDLSGKKLLMEYHVDEDEYLEEGKNESIKNVATINIYLNNEYSGGEICAYDSYTQKSYKYKANPGDAVIMPSCAPFYHAVKNFSGSDRYFMRSFFKYTSTTKNTKTEIEKQKDEYLKKHLQMISVDTNEIEVL